MVNIEKIMDQYDLFWQYPVITEKAFYIQNKNDTSLFGFPWATMWELFHLEFIRLSRSPKLSKIIASLKKVFQGRKYYTCCQHIAFRYFIPLWKDLNIHTVYASHKIKGEDVIDGIIIKPCPLYAVNIADESINNIFQNQDLLNTKRDILYSFAGSYDNDYLTNIRPRIFQMKHASNTYIRNTGKWHFANIVFSEKQNKKGELNIDAKYTENTKKYNELLLQSKYTLCPSGSGPNSIRFWEALGAGSIPILLADTLDLPAHALWEKAILRVAEKDIENIPTLLGQISIEEERKRRENCLALYSHFKNNYNNKEINT